MKNPLETPAFGPVLRKIRLAAGLTQEELATRLGYETANYVSCLEIGTRKPTVELLFKIAAALGLKASHLVTAMEESCNAQGDRQEVNARCGETRKTRRHQPPGVRGT